MFYNMRPPAASTSIEGVSAKSQKSSLIVYYLRFKDCSESRKGRVNPVKLSKEQRANLNSRYLPLHRPVPGFLKKYFFENFIAPLLTNAKWFFLKRAFTNRRPALVCPIEHIFVWRTAVLDAQTTMRKMLSFTHFGLARGGLCAI